MGEVTVVAQGAKAVKVRLEDNDEEWIPYSQIDDSSTIHGESEEEAEGELIISGWLASKKGLA